MKVDHSLLVTEVEQMKIALGLIADNNKQCDMKYDRELSKHQYRLDRHRDDIDRVRRYRDEVISIRDDLVKVESEVIDMKDHLCHCGDSVSRFSPFFPRFHG